MKVFREALVGFSVIPLEEELVVVQLEWSQQQSVH
jgi:hypothetical protein